MSLLLAGIYAHIRISGSQEYTGPLALLDRAFDLGLVGAIASIAFCVGRKLGRKLRLSFFSVAEEFSFSIMLGTGSLALAVLAFGLLGLLKPAVWSSFLCCARLHLRGRLMMPFTIFLRRSRL